MTDSQIYILILCGITTWVVVAVLLFAPFVVSSRAGKLEEEIKRNMAKAERDD